MAAIDDLNAEIAQVGTDVNTAVDKINALIAQVANIPPDQSAAIAAATASLKTAVAPLETILTPTQAPVAAPAQTPSS